jgi:alkanesulfonate monooxygenase SsuD/methylene tetrahydromethanopterin reductase-like flavin-dependent oxidoreductase (luciferase family)
VADGVLFNWLTPAYARKATEWVREGAKAAGRTPPRTYAYVRLALGDAAGERLNEESDRYAAIPAYAAHFERMSVRPIDTAIAAKKPEDIRTAIAAWQGAAEEVVFRAITAKDTVEDNLALVRAAAPAKR